MRPFELMEVLLLLAGTHRRRLATLAERFEAVVVGDDPAAQQLLAQARERLAHVAQRVAGWERRRAKYCTELQTCDVSQERVARLEGWIQHLDECLLRTEFDLPALILDSRTRLYQDTVRAVGIPWEC